MPSPHTPPVVTVLNDILAAVDAQTLAIQSLEATVAAQAEHLEIAANMARYSAESIYGVNPNVTGIWDGTDRYV